MSVPIGLFVGMGVVLFILVAISLYATGIKSIFTSILSIMFAYMLSKMSINRTLTQNISEFDGNGSIVQGTTIVEVPALSYLFIFIGLYMVVVLAVQVLREIKFRESQNTIELD